MEVYGRKLDLVCTGVRIKSKKCAVLLKIIMEKNYGKRGKFSQNQF